MQLNSQHAKTGYIRCLSVQGALTRVKDYECGRCKGFLNHEEVKNVKLGNDE